MNKVTKENKKDIRLTIRVSKFTKERLCEVAKEMRVNPTRLYYYLLCSFLEVYDSKVLTKFTPVPPELLAQIFRVKENRKDVQTAISIIQKIKAKQRKKRLYIKPLEQEIEEMFLKLQEDGRVRSYANDINKRY